MPRTPPSLEETNQVPQMHNGARSNEIVQIVQVRWPPTPVSTFLGVDDQTFQKCCKVYTRHRV